MDPKNWTVSKAGNILQERGLEMVERRRFTAELKAQVVLKLLMEQKSAGHASREYRIKDSVLSCWKQEFIERSPSLFEKGAVQDDWDERIAELERMVGRLATELEMSKKVSRILDSNRRRKERP
jgi:transposase-like protein